jgi:hypothetical protein
VDKLRIDLKNCYGIQSLEKEFDFSTSKVKAYAIYAPNGLMKTSFSKTFENLANGQFPKEERYNRPSTHEIKVNDIKIAKEMIYVLKSEIDISSDSSAITNILVNPINKSRYDELLIDIDKQKNKLIGSLQKALKVKKAEIEKIILADWNESDFPTCISKIQEITVDDDLSPYEYNTIFDSKAIEILKSQEFISKAKEKNKFPFFPIQEFPLLPIPCVCKSVTIHKGLLYSFFEMYSFKYLCVESTSFSLIIFIWRLYIIKLEDYINYNQAFISKFQKRLRSVRPSFTNSYLFSFRIFI